MIESPRSSWTPALIRNFLATYDARDPVDREIAMRLHERLHAELYRRERDHAEWIDFGGEA